MIEDEEKWINVRFSSAITTDTTAGSHTLPCNLLGK